MNVFDIIGPVMIGPSSSHTAGAVRIGNIAGLLLKDKVKSAEIHLYGSFAKTYKGHGTDKALAAGIMGMKPDDGRIRNSLKIAKEQGIQISFIEEDGSSVHPNTARIELTGEDGVHYSVTGASIGGGNIKIVDINGFAVEISGQCDTLVILHKDEPGMVAAVSEYLGNAGINISSFRLSRSTKGGEAVMTIEVDGALNETINQYMNGLHHVIRSIMLCVEREHEV